jgi:hypothetical protein
MLAAAEYVRTLPFVDPWEAHQAQPASMMLIPVRLTPGPRAAGQIRREQAAR